MKLRSSDIDKGGGSVATVFIKGEKKELKRRPFFECGPYHSTDLVICPGTGKSIVEKRKYWQAIDKRRALAEEAKKKYEDKHFPGWIRLLPLALFASALLGILSSFFIAETELKSYVVVGGVLLIVFALVVTLLVDDFRKRIRKKADAIYDSVLDGEEVGA